MSWYENYINNISQDNDSYYREYTQEWINGYFDDSTLVTTIQEEEYPFNNKYNVYDVQVDSVAEITINITKVIGDYISVIFKDCNHKNYRGQKYKYNNDTYLCYDKISDLSKIARTRLIRCNNEISWQDGKGNILTEDVFLGYELSSTNDMINKDGITSNRRLVLYMQNNDKTKTIGVNQRFMFQHSQCFRVEEVDNYNRESGTDKDVTFMRVYVVYSPLLPTDNTELNVCDYYKTNYSLKIDQTDIEQIKGFSGTLKAIVKDYENIINTPVIWSVENKEVVEIDNEGNYTVVGFTNETTKVICRMADNPNVYDEINITVIDTAPTYKQIIVEPIINSLDEKDKVKFTCGVYIEGEKQSDAIMCIPSGVDNECYELNEVSGGFELTNKKHTKDKLRLTFQSISCTDVIMDIELNGLL